MPSISSDALEPAEGKSPVLPAAGIDKAAAIRTMAEARRLYAVAELIHARRLIGGIDSAVPAERSMSLLLELLLQLHGDPIPGDFAGLIERAGAIATEESLLAEGLSPDLAIIHEMRERYVHTRAETLPPEDRRYDRALVRSAEWFDAVQTYLDQRLPSQKSHFRSVLGPTIAIAISFLVGLVAGRHVRGELPPVTAVSVAPAARSDPAGAGFLATFYGDPMFGNVAYSRKDTSIAFHWDIPPPGLPATAYSIRWEGRLYVAESGKYTFTLTSDDGSRLFLDDALAVDNWGGHSELTKVGVVELTKGTHPIRVDFFNQFNPGLIQLEWSSDHFERRLVTSSDLR